MAMKACTLLPGVQRETAPPSKQSVGSVSSEGGEMNTWKQTHAHYYCCYYWQYDHRAQATFRTSIHSSCLQTRQSG